MAYQPLEDLLPKANNSVYRLVRLASVRAMELAGSAAKLVQAPAEQKLATTALDEIRAGKVTEKIADMATKLKEEKAKEEKAKKNDNS